MEQVDRDRRSEVRGQKAAGSVVIRYWLFVIREISRYELPSRIERLLRLLRFLRFTVYRSPFTAYC